MTEDGKEIVFTINTRRFIALSIIAIITIISVGSYVIALLAFHSPSYELRWNASIIDINYFSAPKDPFNPGDQVNITSTTYEGDDYWAVSSYEFFTDTINIRWIITVKDPNDMPIHLASGTLAGVPPVVIPDVIFNLPSDAVTGAYTARLILWTDWLPSGDSRTLTIEQMSFNVGP